SLVAGGNYAHSSPNTLNLQEEKSKETTPKFSTSEANKAVGDFKLIMAEYGPSLAKNDTAKAMEFSTKMKEWSANAQTWIGNLSPEEQQELGIFLEGYASKYMPPPQSGSAPPNTQ